MTNKHTPPPFPVIDDAHREDVAKLESLGISVLDLIEGSVSASLWANALTPDDGERPNLDSGLCTFWGAQVASQSTKAETVWTPRAIENVSDVIPWAAANVEQVDEYMATTGRDAAQVGVDFAFSRAGHGTGLWDRGAGELGKELHETTKPYGECTLLVSVDEHGDLTEVDAL